jgi:uncharacterized metal-binding protein YceD (DUF177 family)
MKWTINQLRKITVFPFKFETEYEFKDLIQTLPDLIDIGKAIVSGEIYRINFDSYRIVYHVEVPMVLECSLTLEPVDYLLQFTNDEIYSTNPTADEFAMEKNTLSLDDIVYESIISLKPFKVVHPNALAILKEQGVEFGVEPTLDQDEEILSYSDGIDENKNSLDE